MQRSGIGIHKVSELQTTKRESDENIKVLKKENIALLSKLQFRSYLREPISV